MSSSPFTSFVVLLWMHSRTFTTLLDCGAQNCTRYSRWCHTNTEHSRINHLLTGWLCCVLYTPGCSLPSWLPGHTAGSHWACYQAALPGPFLQGCSPAATPEAGHKYQWGMEQPVLNEYWRQWKGRRETRNTSERLVHR